MQELYDKITEEFTEAFEKYMNDEITFEEIQKIQEKENLILQHKDWSDRRIKLKENIFQFSKKLYSEINECEQKIRTFKTISTEIEFEIDEEALLSHAMLMARNKVPPSGFENSNWYLGPYPTLQTIEALNESNNKNTTA